jgi:hypothetical protein
MPEMRPDREFEPSIAHNRRVPKGPGTTGPFACLGGAEARSWSRRGPSGAHSRAQIEGRRRTSCVVFPEGVARCRSVVGVRARGVTRCAPGPPSGDDRREHAEFQVIEAGKASAYSKTTMKALHGLLNRRNECAHPSEYFTDLNETLGYIGELFKRITQLQP